MWWQSRTLSDPPLGSSRIFCSWPEPGPTQVLRITDIPAAKLYLWMMILACIEGHLTRLFSLPAALRARAILHDLNLGRLLAEGTHLHDLNLGLLGLNVGLA